MLFILMASFLYRSKQILKVVLIVLKKMVCLYVMIFFDLLLWKEKNPANILECAEKYKKELKIIFINKQIIFKNKLKIILP